MNGDVEEGVVETTVPVPGGLAAKVPPPGSQGISFPPTPESPLTPADYSTMNGNLEGEAGAAAAPNTVLFTSPTHDTAIAPMSPPGHYLLSNLWVLYWRVSLIFFCTVAVSYNHETKWKFSEE